MISAAAKRLAASALPTAAPISLGIRGWVALATEATRPEDVIVSAGRHTSTPSTTRHSSSRRTGSYAVVRDIGGPPHPARRTTANIANPRLTVFMMSSEKTLIEKEFNLLLLLAYIQQKVNPTPEQHPSGKLT